MACDTCSSGFDSRDIQKNFLGGRRINGTSHDKNCMMRSLQVALSSRPNVKYAQVIGMKILVSEFFLTFWPAMASYSSIFLLQGSFQTVTTTSCGYIDLFAAWLWGLSPGPSLLTGGPALSRI